MGVHYGNRPTGNAPASKLLNDYGGAAAAYSLRLLDLNNASKPVVRVRRASDNAEKDFTANEVDRGEVEKWTQVLPSPGSYDASRDVGYFGEVSSSDLISGDDLATELNLTAGTSQNSDAGWLKFYVGPNAFCNRQGNAYILYVAKRTMRYDLSWNDINSAGGVDGTTEVEIDGQSYSVRLMQGADADPSTFSRGTICSDNAGGNSEWNELFYRVSEKIPDCANPTEGMEGGSSTTSHGGPQNGSNWANFTNSELNVQVGNGRFTWCQEVDGIISSRRATRGNTGVAFFQTNTSSFFNTNRGWRPCLQINLGQSGDVSAFVTTWYDQSGNDNHATQTTATNQPKIVDAGTLVTENGKAAVDFDGVGQFMVINQDSINLPITLYVVLRFNTATGNVYVKQLSGNNGGILFRATLPTVVDQSAPFPQISYDTTDYHLAYFEGIEDGQTVKLGINGANLLQSSNTINGFVNNGTLPQSIGSRPDQLGNDLFKGKLQEIVNYNSDQSANRIAIESNINSYYDIY